jgi:hypothetical protein
MKPSDIQALMEGRNTIGVITANFALVRGERVFVSMRDWRGRPRILCVEVREQNELLFVPVSQVVALITRNVS